MFSRRGWTLFLLFPLLACLAQPAFPDRPGAQSSVEQLLDRLSRVRTFSEASVSPDGQKVAWVQAVHGKDNAATDRSAIYVTAVNDATAEPTRITAGNSTAAYSDHGIAWSPDSRKLAFLSDKEENGQMQLYTVLAAGGPARKLTIVKGLLATPRWSPDGKQLAVLFTENPTRAAGPLQAGPQETGVLDEQRIDEQRVSLVDADTGRLRLLSPADLYVYEYDWSPDGKSVAAIAAHGAGDNNWYIARLYTFSAASGKMTEILKPAMQIGVPRWSPDGQTIAFIGGLMSDEGVIGGDIFTIPAAGGTPRNRTPGLKASASWMAWAPSGAQILFAELIDGSCGIASLDLAHDRITQSWVGAQSVSADPTLYEPSISLSSDVRTMAIIRQSFRQPPEVWAGPMHAVRRLTHVNAAAKPAWGTAKSLHWQCDGRDVQGWLVYPTDYDPQLRYPMIVSVHGGPASARLPRWPGPMFDFTVFSPEGYFVFFPNPRGSYGQGEDFTRGNVKDFGYGDLRDILSGVDHIVKTLPVDNERIAIAGWSYGGYMTMWAVTQTNRFRAAVAGAGIANWQSYYGQNGIEQWMIPYFGATLYDDPAVYARSSPITFIKQAKTPTLVLVGERDLECPAPQSREFWHALKTLRVPTQLVIYPDEGHAITEAKHRRDVMRRTIEWLNKYLRADGKAKTSRAEK